MCVCKSFIMEPAVKENLNNNDNDVCPLPPNRGAVTNC